MRSFLWILHCLRFFNRPRGTNIFFVVVMYSYFWGVCVKECYLSLFLGYHFRATYTSNVEWLGMFGEYIFIKLTKQIGSS